MSALIRPDIEAMARAMMAVSDRDGVTPVWDDEPEIAREAYRKLARAAAATSLVADQPTPNSALENGTRSIPVDTLKWWRQLVDINPHDLAPRIDAYIAEKREPEIERLRKLMDGPRDDGTHVHRLDEREGDQ